MAGERGDLTLEDYLRMPDDGRRRELVRGRLQHREAVATREADVATRLMSALHRHAEARHLGSALPTGTDFLLQRDPDTVLVPDVAFVGTERWPDDLPVGYFPGPPDLVAEIVAPSEDPAGAQARVHEWLRAGCRLVWVVEPEGRTVAVYDGEDRGELLGETEVLDGGAVLPGFAIPVRELF